MIVWLSIGIISAITSLYLGKKGWHALHKAVGISPGVLIYHNPNAPLYLTDMTWQQLTLNQQHLSSLSDPQLLQLQRLDNKMSAYQLYQQELRAQNLTPILTEDHFVLEKWIEIRLPQMLASHYHVQPGIRNRNTKERFINTDNANRLIASQILQEGLDNIEQRLDNLLKQLEVRHLQELQVMQRYMNEHNHTHH